MITDIAKLKKKSVQTIATQYASAFELITGHPFSAENWFTVMAPIKFNSFIHERGAATTNRRLNSQSKRDVPDSVLQPRSPDRSIVGQAEITDYLGGSEEQLIVKIQRMILEGLPSPQIYNALGFENKKCLDAIEHIRKRIKEKPFE